MNLKYFQFYKFFHGSILCTPVLKIIVSQTFIHNNAFFYIRHSPDACAHFILNLHTWLIIQVMRHLVGHYEDERIVCFLE